MRGAEKKSAPAFFSSGKTQKIACNLSQAVIQYNTQPMPVWWNWQTRGTQNPVVAIPYRFDPDHRHQKISRTSVGIFFIHCVSNGIHTSSTHQICYRKFTSKPLGFVCHHGSAVYISALSIPDVVYSMRKESTAIFRASDNRFLRIALRLS